MRKRLHILLLIAIVAIASCFVACDKKDAVTITIHIKSQTYTIERNRGDNLIGFDPETLTNPEGLTYIGGSSYDGLFYDEDCLFRYDESKPIEHDITLYVFSFYLFNPNLNFVTFVFEGNKYNFHPQLNHPVTVFDFIATAYGKPISPACLEFYSDEAMQHKFELYGLNYQDECEPTNLIWGGSPPYSYTIYVKRVPAPELPTYNT